MWICNEIAKEMEQYATSDGAWVGLEEWYMGHQLVPLERGSVFANLVMELYISWESLTIRADAYQHVNVLYDGYELDSNDFQQIVLSGAVFDNTNALQRILDRFPNNGEDVDAPPSPEARSVYRTLVVQMDLYGVFRRTWGNAINDRMMLHRSMKASFAEMVSEDNSEFDTDLDSEYMRSIRDPPYDGFLTVVQEVQPKVVEYFKKMTRWSDEWNRVPEDGDGYDTSTITYSLGPPLPPPPT